MIALKLAGMFLFLITSASAQDPQIAGNSTPGETRYPDDAMRLVGAFEDLRFPERNVVAGVVDSTNGIACWAGGEGRNLESFAIGPNGAAPLRRGAIELRDTRDGPLGMAIHPAMGWAFVARGRGKLEAWKLSPDGGFSGVSLPLIVGGTTHVGEYEVGTLAVDQSRGELLAGILSAETRLVRWRIASNSVTVYSSLTLPAEDAGLSCSAIDPAGFLYLGTKTSPARVVMLDLYGSPIITRVGAVELPPEAANATMCAIDPAGRRIYFANSDGVVVQLGIGDGATLPSFLATTGPFASAKGLAIDAEGGVLFVAAGDSIQRIRLGDFEPMEPLSVPGHGGLQAPVFDSASGSLLAVATLPMPEVLKFEEFVRQSPFGIRVLQWGALSQDLTYPDVVFSKVTTELGPRLAALDPGNGSHPPRVLGFAPSDLGVNPGFVHPDGRSVYYHAGVWDFNKATFDPERGMEQRYVPDVGFLEAPFRTGLFDETGQYAVFGGTAPRLHKFELRGPGEIPVYIGAVNTPVAFGSGVAIGDMAVYAAYGYAETTQLYTVNLGEGSELPVVLSTTVMHRSSYGSLSSEVLADGTFFFKTYNTSLGSFQDDYQLTRLGFVSPEAGPQVIEHYFLGNDRTGAWSLVGLSERRRALMAFSGGSGPSPHLANVNFDSTSPLSQLLGTLTIGAETERHTPVGVSLDAGKSLMQSQDGTKLLQIALDHRDALHACRVTLPTEGIVQTARFYAHAAGANVRMALYNNSEPRRLLWQSEPAVTSAGEELSFPVQVAGSGLLPAGDYWLGWQTDSREFVASWTPTAPSDSITFHANMEFGPAPAELPAASRTSTTGGTWTAYLTYRDAWGGAWVVR